jgi:hypothetical protein
MSIQRENTATRVALPVRVKGKAWLGGDSPHSATAESVSTEIAYPLGK